MLRRSAVKISICGLFLLAMASPVQLTAETLLRGTVRGSEGGAVAEAVVFIHWDPSGSEVGLDINIGIKEDLVVRTDRRGDFAVKLPPGFYDVLITGMALTPVCRKIRIREGHATTFSPRLAADPQVSKELD